MVKLFETPTDVSNPYSFEVARGPAPAHPGLTAEQAQAQRNQLNDKGLFWEPLRNEDEQVTLIEAARRYQEAKNRGDELKAGIRHGPSGPFASRKPRDMLRQAAPPPFTLDEVPPSIGFTAQSWSQAAGYDISGAIVAAVTTAAGAIDDRYKLTVRAESNWSVSARQWSFLCGAPSAGKSPAINAVMGHLKGMHIALHATWEMNNKDLKKEERDPEPALFTSDANVPALSEMLRANPRGAILQTSEFASWIGAIDSGDKGDAAKNRGDWLQLRDGGAYQVNRIQRGSILVPNWGMSVLAACTPDGLAKQMKQMPEDGLIQRFVPCILAKPTEEPQGDARGAMTTWGLWLDYAYAATTCHYDTFIDLSPEARALFDAEVRSVRELQKATEDFAPAYASHLGKHPGMLAEIALIFHVFWTGQKPLPTQISVEVMACAIRYMRKVRKHAHTLYSSILSASPSYDLARAVARSLVAADEPMTTLSRADMSAMCSDFRKADDRLRREAVQLLEDADWLEANSRGSYGGWPREYLVHPQVFAIFAREGEQWRARRAAVKDLIAEAE